MAKVGRPKKVKEVAKKSPVLQTQVVTKPYDDTVNNRVAPKLPSLDD